MTDPNDDYLWDPSDEPDPEIQKLEELLSGYAYTGNVPAMPVRRRWPWLLWRSINRT